MIDLDTHYTFAVNIHSANLKDYIPVDKYVEELYRLKDDENEKKQSSNVTRTLNTGFRVTGLHENDVFEDYHHILADIVQNAFSKLYEQKDFENELSVYFHSWGNIMHTYGYNTYHNHPECEWACILYLKNCSSAKTVFHDTRPTYNKYGDLYNSSYFAPESSFSGDPGALLIFPSYLNHSVETNNSEEDRITISTNIRLSPFNAEQIEIFAGTEAEK